MKLTVLETAISRGVTKAAVYNWIKNGLPYDTRKEIGRKEYKVINPNDVDSFLGLKDGESNGKTN